MKEAVQDRVFSLGPPMCRISGNLAPGGQYANPYLEILEAACLDEQGYAPAQSVAVCGWDKLRELHSQLAAFLSEARMKGWIE